MIWSRPRRSGDASPASRGVGRSVAVAERLEARRLFATFDVLVFSKTAGERHESIDEGIGAIQRLGAENAFEVVATEDAAIFSDAGLAPFEAVVFLNTTGDILNDEQQATFERYIVGGGGFVGVHAAAEAEYDWPWYRELVGASVDGHADVQRGQVRLTLHPANRFLFSLPAYTLSVNDEWYNFQSNPRAAGAEIVLTIDEDSYTGGTMGWDHPIAWSRWVGAGRSFYTGMGHAPEVYAQPLFLAHLLSGIKYVGAARPPTASGSAERRDGPRSRLVYFDGSVDDPVEHDRVTYSWDFENDGTIDYWGDEADTYHVYPELRDYTARLVVTDYWSERFEVLVPVPLEVDPSNIPPAAGSDEAATPADTVVVVDLLSNDTDANGTIDPTSVEIVEPAVGGTAWVDPASGAVTFTPSPGFVGDAHFKYVVRDDRAEASPPAYVKIAVTPPTALSVKLSGRVPATAVTGAKTDVRQVVTVLNTSTSAFRGEVTLKVFASADEFVETWERPLASVTRNMRLKPGASRAVPLRIKMFFNNRGDGEQRILARASTPSEVSDEPLVSNIAASTTRIMIAAPLADLAGSFVAATSGTVVGGGRGGATVLVRNAGNTTLAGRIAVPLHLITPGGTLVPLGTAVRRVNLEPGGTKLISGGFPLPKTPGTYTLGASIQTAPEVTEDRAHKENNVFTSDPFTIL